MLWAMLASPLLLWGYVRTQRLRGRAEAALADAHLLGHLWTRPSALRRHLPVGLYVTAVTPLTPALARTLAARPLPTNRAAVILALDVGKRMVGEEGQP